MSNWTCPYCDRAQVLTSNVSVQDILLNQRKSKQGPLVCRLVQATCANPTCQKLFFSASLYEFGGTYQHGSPTVGEQRYRWQLLPESQGKPQPEYIPKAIRDDYNEACRIRDLSAKASATLARRCLQGMIRDFTGISKARLIDEIEELRKQVAAGKAPVGVLPDSAEAIDHVRSIGNIGAHMEKDINLIVEIDPGEVQKLIGLIELLFREWYVARRDRQTRLADLKKMAAQKTADRKGKPTPAPDPAPEPEPEPEKIVGQEAQGDV